MNERTEELLKIATENILGVPVVNHKKFAELIVNECADIAQQHNKSPVSAALAVGYVIREHFGVTE